MLDCLHFLFEEDFTAVSEDHAQSRSAIREHLYSNLYGVSYNFKLPKRKDPATGRSTASSNEFDYSEYEASLAQDKVEPLNPKKNEPFSPRDNNKKKIEFVEASSVPFVETSFEGLDAPLG